MYCALSFDDGPNTTTTYHMLDVLKKHGVKASFFIIGQNVTPESEKAMKACAEYGCDIENHSWTHPFMNQMTADQIKDEISRTTKLIEDKIGVSPKFFRPPFIAVNDLMYETVGLPFICGMGCEDWVPEVSADERVKRMVDMAYDGVIYLLHDMEGNEASVEAVDKLIPLLKEKGFEFVTVPEIFEKCGVDPKTPKALWRNILQEETNH